jgi:transcriptional regulator with XRE-family HTH domain
VPPQGHDWLSRTLRELREKTGMSGSEAARQVGLSQSRMSRIEAGRFLPTEDEISKLADLYQAPVRTRRRLLQVVKDLRAEDAPSRVVLQRGAWRMQQRIARIEENAHEISGFANNIVPGLVQTPEYARAVFADGGDLSPDDVERSVAGRVARSAVLEAGSREITLIMTEGALRWHAGSPQIMVEQLERLARLAVGGRVNLGVIPWTQPTGTFPLHGFTMYDRREVVIGTRSATAFISDARDVADYSALFDQLDALAVYEEAAAQIIAAIAADYRQLIK